MEMCATSHNLGTKTHAHTADIRRYMMVQAWHSMSEFSCTAETVREALVILEAKGLCQLALVGLHSQTYVNHVIVCYNVTFRWKTMGMRATQMHMAVSGLCCTCSFTCVRIWFPLFWGMLWQLPSGKSHGTVRAMLPRELWQTVRPSFLWQVRHFFFRFLRSLSSPQTSPTLMCQGMTLKIVEMKPNTEFDASQTERVDSCNFCQQALNPPGQDWNSSGKPMQFSCYSTCSIL